MNTTAWKTQTFGSHDQVAAFLSAMKNEWDALNSKVLFNEILSVYVVIYPVPFSGPRP